MLTLPYKAVQVVYEDYREEINIIDVISSRFLNSKYSVLMV